MKTISKILAAAGIVSLMAMPAFAGEDASCNDMLKKAEKAMKTAALDEAGKKAVSDLMAKAQESMKAGDEKGCKAMAGEALKALGVQEQQ